MNKSKSEFVNLEDNGCKNEEPNEIIIKPETPNLPNNHQAPTKTNHIYNQIITEVENKTQSCNECGAKIIEGSLYCNKCGSKLRF